MSLQKGLKPFPIMVKVWAGNDFHDLIYIYKSLPSLLNSDLLKEAQVILIDDCSPNPKLMPFLKKLKQKYSFVEVWRNPHRMGPNKGQEYNVPKIVERFPDAPFYVFCDDDIIYHPMWLRRLIQVYFEAYEIGLRGIFTAINVPIRPSYKEITLPTSKVLLKKRQAAFNWLVPRDVYEEVGPFRDIGIAYDTDYCDRMEVLGLPVICLKPSYVQNIGYYGAYQHSHKYTAKDFVGEKDILLRLIHVVGIAEYYTKWLFSKYKSLLIRIFKVI